MVSEAMMALPGPISISTIVPMASAPKILMFPGVMYAVAPVRPVADGGGRGGGASGDGSDMVLLRGGGHGANGLGDRAENYGTGSSVPSAGTLEKEDQLIAAIGLGELLWSLVVLFFMAIYLIMLFSVVVDL